MFICGISPDRPQRWADFSEERSVCKWHCVYWGMLNLSSVFLFILQTCVQHLFRPTRCLCVCVPAIKRSCCAVLSEWLNNPELNEQWSPRVSRQTATASRGACCVIATSVISVISFVRLFAKPPQGNFTTPHLLGISWWDQESRFSCSTHAFLFFLRHWITKRLDHFKFLQMPFTSHPSTFCKSTT